MNKLVIGTWKSLEHLSEEEFRLFINECISLGCNEFDTALVYGNSENILGEYSNINITTKIPGKKKPITNQDIAIEDVYPIDWAIQCFEKSKKNMNNSIPGRLLLHNWNQSWVIDYDILQWLNSLKDDYNNLKVGISIPNGFDGKLNNKLLGLIDVIMAPKNNGNCWIENNYSLIKNSDIEIMCRSLFLGGKNKPQNKKMLQQTLKGVFFADKIVIGTTNIEHVKDILELIQ